MTYYWCGSQIIGEGSCILPGNWGLWIRNLKITDQLTAALIAKEHIFECSRLKFFPDAPSRLTCNFLFKSIEDASKWKESTNRYLDIIYEVECLDSSKSNFEAKVFAHPVRSNASAAEVEKVALRYWNGEGDGPIEILTMSRIRILRFVSKLED